MDNMGDYWRDVKPHLKEENAKYREKNYDSRIEYAIKRFEENNIKYKLCNESNGHFNLYYKGKVILSFWSWTGKIYSPIMNLGDSRGIYTCIKKYKILVNKIRREN